MKTLHRKNSSAKSANPSVHQRLMSAIVSEVVDQHFVVVDSLPRTAFRAASCITVPSVGDTVLLARTENDLWIIAVLVTAGSRPQSLEGREITIKGDKINIKSPLLNTTSQQWDAQHHQISLISVDVQAKVGSLHWIGQKVSALVDFVFSRQRRVLRQVAEIETVQCGHYSLQANHAMSLSAETGLLTAQGMMKVDAAQIHLG